MLFSKFTLSVSSFALISYFTYPVAAATEALNKLSTNEKNAPIWTNEAKQAAKKIDDKTMMKTIETLASNSFEGRSPGTLGEEETVHYLIKEFKRLGLKPGNPNGQYIQNVPMISSTSEYEGRINIQGKEIKLAKNKDWVAFTQHQVPKVEINNSDMVFVGYGVSAPEYDWDDYKGLDVKGKTLLMLVNDPQIPDATDPTKLDQKLFKGKAMTYYGRWTYKFEIAAQKGAAAVIIIHDTAMAAYPFDVVITSWGRERFFNASQNKNLDRSAIESWITGEKAREIFQASSLDLESLKKSALSRDFKPVLLNAKLNVSLTPKEREITSRNVVAKIEGSDSKLKKRTLIYSAHWDHFGRDPKLQGDQIYHGALDNASGVAGMLEVAKAFRSLKTPPKSTILFIATTAEERGMLGSRYYVEHPLYPIGTTLADINFDGVSIWGKTRDLQIVGQGTTTLEDGLRTILEFSGRNLVPEEDTEKGMYYRTDQFEFSKVGIPSIWYRTGFNYIDKPASFGKEKLAHYVAHDYHKVSDVIESDWNLSGAVEDLQAFFRLGLEISQSSTWPEWKPGTEFHAKRSESKKLRMN